MAVLARSKKDLEELLDKKEEADKGLNVNQDKTKNMKEDRHCSGCRNTITRILENFKCLGTLINNRNNRESEIEHKIQQGYVAYFKYERHLQNKKINEYTKVWIYKVTVRTVVTYAVETINIKTSRRKINRVQKTRNDARKK